MSYIWSEPPQDPSLTWREKLGIVATVLALSLMVALALIALSVFVVTSEWAQPTVEMLLNLGDVSR